MRFDLENLNPGTWFYFEGSETEGICVRPLSEDALTEIRSKVVTKKTEFKRGQRFETEKVDKVKDREMTIDFCLVDWNVLDKKGKAIPLTCDNKVKMVMGSPAFSVFFTESLQAANAMAQEDEEESVKN